jgi:hypothetical protein
VHPHDAAPTPQARAGVPVAVPLLAGHLQSGLDLRRVRHRDLQELHRVVGRDPVAQALLVRLAVRTAQPCASSRPRTSWWLTWCRWAAPAATAVAPGAGRSTAVSWRLRAQAIAAGRAGLVDQLGVGQVQRLGSGVVQPPVAAAYPDQLLVQPVDAPAVRGELPGVSGKTGRTASSPPARCSLTPRNPARRRRRSTACPRPSAGWPARGRGALVIELAGLDIPAMDESAVPALQDPSPRDPERDAARGVPGLHAQVAGPRRCWLDRCLIRRRSMGCWPGSGPSGSSCWRSAAWAPEPRPWITRTV